MVITTKDALASERLEVPDGNLDKEALLADMEALANEAGDWRDHLPYEVALDYHEKPKIQAIYKPHVDSCIYCQRLIDTLHPSDRVLRDLQSIRVRAAEVPISAKPACGGFGSWFGNPLPMAASLFVGIFAGLTGLYLIKGATLVEFADDPIGLVQMERSQAPLEKFKAARIYLAAENPEIAYQRIVEGFRLAQLNSEVLRTVSSASKLSSVDSKSYDESEKELQQIQARVDLLGDEDMLRIVQLQAQLGRHEQALESLRIYLESSHTTSYVANDFSVGVLGADADR
jgi:hypothetical protein